MKLHSRLGFQNFLFPSSKLNDKDKYEDYAKRIRKTLYYGRLPSTDRPSLPVTGILVDKFGRFCKRDGFDQLNLHEASSICYDACVTPCSVIVALLYLERLRTQNPEYLAKTSPSQVFIVALMVASKYLYDDGEEDEVFNDEWATSAAILLSDLNEAEKHFLSAIDWNLFVDVKSFMDGLLYVESSIARDQGNFRGFYVYSDLVTLSKCLPPLWTSFLNLVGSALVVCIVGYTATVFIVVAGTLGAKQGTVHVANQLCLSLLPAPPTPCQVHLPNCTLPLDNYDSLIKNSSLTNAEEIFSDFGEENKDEKDSPMGSNSFSARFNALRTLTTALLLASSSKFIEIPTKNLSRFSTTMEHSLDCCNSLFQDDATRIAAENVSFSHEAFYKYSDNGQNEQQSLPRTRKVPRTSWRKPKCDRGMNRSDPNVGSSNPQDSEVTLPGSCDVKSRLEFDVNTNQDYQRTHLYAYTRIVLDSLEDFLNHQSTWTNSHLPKHHSYHESNHNFHNSSIHLSTTLSLNPNENYYPRVVLENDAFSKDRSSVPSGVWSSLFPFDSPSKVSDYIHMDWKYGNLMMLT